MRLSPNSNPTPGDYNDRLPILPSILFGAFFTLAVAWMLGNICLRRLPVPWTIALAVGAAAESGIVFLLLVCGVGNRVSFILLGAVCLAAVLAAGARRGAARGSRAGAGGSREPCIWRARRWHATGAVPDQRAGAGAGAGCRRVSPGTDVRIRAPGRLSHRVGFYEMLPQGLEMLFVPAFAFGRHSAARLVHCAFLLASVPLMWRIGRRLRAAGSSSAGGGGVLLLRAGDGDHRHVRIYRRGRSLLHARHLLCSAGVARHARCALPGAGGNHGGVSATPSRFPGGLVAILAVVFVVAVERGIRARQLALLTGAALVVARRGCCGT
jgi:hypothetical protein